MFKAALFDLDDTLIDHKYSRRCGLKVLQSMFPALQVVDLEELEKAHEQQLKANYLKTLSGQMTSPNAFYQRIKALGAHFGLRLNHQQVQQVAQKYEAEYIAHRRLIRGVIPLLQHFKKQALTLGLVTNGLVSIQEPKIQLCHLNQWFNFIIISEAVGIQKPDQGIFELALHKARVSPKEALFFGDSWEIDIWGAYGCGIPSVWLNRYHLPCPAPGLAIEISSYQPLAKVLKKISSH